MKHIIITTKHIKGSILNELKRNYTVIEWDEQHHLIKDIRSIGVAEILIINLSISILHSVNTNKALKWIQNQSLTEYNVIYEFHRRKYKTLVSMANVYVKNLPVVIGKTLEQTLQVCGSLGDGSSLSISRDDLKIINQSISELSPEVEAERLVSILNDYLDTKGQLSEITKVYNELKLSMGNRPNNIVHTTHDEVKAKPKAVVRTIQLATNSIKLIENGVEQDCLRFTSRSEQRRVHRQALKWKMRQS